MEKEVLECILKKLQKDVSISRILSWEDSPAVGKFINYLSTVKRKKLKVLLGNGRVAEKSIIIKESVCPYDDGGFLKKYNVFKIETMIYEVVLKHMEYLMEEFEDTRGTMWCNLLYHIPDSFIVLEDLKISGFKILSRRIDLFSLEESLFLMNGFGRYHGMAKVLEQRGIIDRRSYKEWYAITDEGIHKYWYWFVDVARKGIKLHWGPEWEALAERLRMPQNEFQERLLIYNKVDENKFNVLNHGDTHKNNLMFKCDWKGKPIDMRLLDFQVAHYNSPCYDLTYFLYLAVNPVVRRQHHHQLTEVYHQSLIRTLEFFNYTGKKPELEELVEENERLSYLGLALYLFGFQTMIIEDVEKYFDFETIVKSEGTEGYNYDLFKNEDYKNLVMVDMKVFIKKFL